MLRHNGRTNAMGKGVTFRVSLFSGSEPLVRTAIYPISFAVLSLCAFRFRDTCRHRIVRYIRCANKKIIQSVVSEGQSHSCECPKVTI